MTIKPIIKLDNNDLSQFWNSMPDNCVKVIKQYEGDWVGSYSSNVLLLCKDGNDKVIKLLDNKELPFEIDWCGKEILIKE